MTNKKTVKRVIKRKKQKRTLRPLTKLFCFVVIIFSCWLIYGIGTEINTTITLKRELVEVEERLNQVKEEKEYLITQKSKLEDPNYVQSFARGNYTMTKEGEKIYYLPPKDK